MSDAWDKKRQAQEEQYFEKKEREALERLKARKESKPRLSPITGKPMTQLTYEGVVVDRCVDSGGIWLDAGELEAIVRNLTHKQAEESQNWFSGLISSIKGK